MSEPVRCETCNLEFKNIVYYNKHLGTSRHILRSSDSDISPTISCICGKLYSFQQSLRVHRKKCNIYQNSKTAPPSNAAAVDVPISSNAIQKNDIWMETMQKKIDVLETENKVRDVIIEKMQQTLETNEKERSKIRTQIDNLRQNQEKSREKRKKISNDMRKQIVDKQNNTCGECTFVLTPFYQIDHIIGLQFGGTDDESNLMALCCECHAKKSVSENQCRKQIKEAIQMIWREHVKGYV